MTDTMAQNITVKIAGKEFPLAVEPAMEGKIRTAVEKINERFDYIADHYGNVSQQDVLSMILLEEEAKLIEMQEKDSGDARTLAREIDAINAQLDEYLTSR